MPEDCLRFVPSDRQIESSLPGLPLLRSLWLAPCSPMPWIFVLFLDTSQGPAFQEDSLVLLQRAELVTLSPRTQASLAS